ncbi:MAG TPA: HNH endonuclease [Ktedonobacteraceae bacterium]
MPHISLPASTLIIILAVIIVLAILLRLVNLRSRVPRRRTAPPRAKRSPGKARNPFPTRRASSRRHDHGLEIARKYGHESRSPEWPAVAHAHLAKEPACRVCGHRGQGLQVHHIKPFHLYPDLELDPNNLITLCELKGRDHHLLIGHLDDWESYNPQVRTDVDKYHKENAVTIRANPAWQKEEQHRPQPHS